MAKGHKTGGRTATPPYDRVMAKVVPEGDCLVFTGKANRAGYGRTSIQVDGRTVEIMAHRVVYEHHHGPVPEGLFVLHSCDNPPCVNVEHLRAGTAWENSHDMVERKRGRKGAERQVCARGHDLAVHGIARATRSQNPDKEGALYCAECRREYVREHRERATGVPFSGLPHNRDKTHCKRGHDLANAYINPSSGGRQCRACMNDRARRKATA